MPPLFLPKSVRDAFKAQQEKDKKGPQFQKDEKGNFIVKRGSADTITAAPAAASTSDLTKPTPEKVIPKPTEPAKPTAPETEVKIVQRVPVRFTRPVTCKVIGEEIVCEAQGDNKVVSLPCKNIVVDYYAKIKTSIKPTEFEFFNVTEFDLDDNKTLTLRGQRLPQKLELAERKRQVARENLRLAQIARQTNPGLYKK
jgi:hypothetical protein